MRLLESAAATSEPTSVKVSVSPCASVIPPAPGVRSVERLPVGATLTAVNVPLSVAEPLKPSDTVTLTL